VAELRPGWRRMKLAECCAGVSDRVDDPSASGFERFVGLEHFATDSTTIRHWASTETVTSAMKVFRSGDVLVARRNVYLKRTAYAEFDGVCSGDAIVLRPMGKVCLPALLPYVLSTDTFWGYAISEADGSMSKRLNVHRLLGYEFALPPLEEQRRLAETLSAAEALIGALDHLMQSVYLAEIGMLESAISHATGSALVPVRELLREPPRNGISPSVNSGGEGLRTVSISAVKDGTFDPAGCIKHANIGCEVAAPFFVKKDDVFVIRGNGNRQLCGKAGLSETSYDNLFYPDLLIRLRFDTKRILPGFAVAQWNIPSVHGRLSARAKSSNGIWKVNGQDIRAHRLSVPTIEEQREILEGVGALLGGVQAARAREQSLRHFKAAILGSVSGQS